MSLFYSVFFLPSLCCSLGICSNIQANFHRGGNSVASPQLNKDTHRDIDHSRLPEGREQQQEKEEEEEEKEEKEGRQSVIYSALGKRIQFL